MRVEIVESLQSPDQPGRVFSDVAVERAVKNFLLAMGDDESLFQAQNTGVRLLSLAENQSVCSGTLVFRVRDSRFARGRSAYTSLAEKLSELLRQAGSADALAARLSIGAGERDAAPGEFALLLQLEASANSPEQAGLRWGLGLAHVQQAVLFASRVLRQQAGQGGN